MTHFFQRTAIILVATSALCASPALARTHHHHAGKKGHSAHHAAPAAGANGTIVTLPGEAATYIVKKGDTLAKIADQLDTTVADLKRDNKLKSNDLTPGQELKGPAKERKAYVVAHGDTPYSIAQRFHVSVGDLRSENGLTSKAAIHSGQKLKLPAGFKAPAGLADEGGPALRGPRPSPVADQISGDEGGSRTAAGRVEIVPGGATTYKVKKGDTLAKVADKLGTSVAELKRDNHLKGNSISPGRRLKGPHSGSSRVYVAASGDTMQGISTRFGVSVQALKSANGMKKRTNSVHGGQRLRLPGAARDHGRSDVLDRATVGYPRPAEPDRGPLPSQPQPYQPGAIPRPYPPSSSGTPGQPPSAAPQVSAGPTDAQVMSMGKGRFQWPLKGDIISDFGPLNGGQRNDGINIRAAAGDVVHSAADGDVVYAGDQVPGFGNLVLIKHADGWVTAYGHLSRVDVKMQQKVTQGQQIGQAGQTGGVTETQLHFEVRYAPNPLERARPVDPKLVLPK
jgi:murein DD-endopeptidase MepM/ murein hydrolase activator NlpD